jgi:hypothetical protein
MLQFINLDLNYNMMITTKGMILTARPMLVETRFYECINPTLKPSSTTSEVKFRNFALLKERGFSFDHNTFDEKGVFKGDNYGNYLLEQITLFDFEKIENEYFISKLDSHLRKIFQKYFDNIDSEKESYIRTVITSSDLFIDFTVESLEIFELNTNSPELNLKRHKYYTLWEHFKSYIFFFNRGSNNNFVYLQIGFD